MGHGRRKGGVSSAHTDVLSQAMGLNAVQTLIPWFLMEPSPGVFRDDGPSFALGTL